MLTKYPCKTHTQVLFFYFHNNSTLANCTRCEQTMRHLSGERLRSSIYQTMLKKKSDIILLATLRKSENNVQLYTLRSKRNTILTLTSQY